MPNGIIIFGANGCGKTTIGREIAKTLHCKHLDVEDYYFQQTDILYKYPRKKHEVIKLMLKDINLCELFIFSGVTGDYGDVIISMYKLAVYLSAPTDLRIKRIKERIIDKHGEFISMNDDLKKNREDFIEFAQTRDLTKIDQWADTLTCPIVCIDATRPIIDITQEILNAYFAL